MKMKRIIAWGAGNSMCFYHVQVESAGSGLHVQLVIIKELVTLCSNWNRTNAMRGRFAVFDTLGQCLLVSILH